MSACSYHARFFSDEDVSAAQPVRNSTPATMVTKVSPHGNRGLERAMAANAQVQRADDEATKRALYRSRSRCNDELCARAGGISAAQWMASQNFRLQEGANVKSANNGNGHNRNRAYWIDGPIDWERFKYHPAEIGPNRG